MPPRTVVGTAGTEVWTHRRLWDRVCRIRDHAFAELPVGARVVMAQAGGADYVAGFLAALEAWLVPVPLYLPDADEIERFVQAGPPHTARLCTVGRLHQRRTRRRARTRCRIKRACPSALRIRCPDIFAATSARAAATAAGQVAFLQYTSGSTGEPKGIVNTHESMLRQLAIAMALWNRPDDILHRQLAPAVSRLGHLLGGAAGAGRPVAAPL